MPSRRNLFDPKSEKPYRISRSGLELFHDCPRCFYYDKRLGHSRPAGFPFNLNSAVDALLKREFDAFRKLGKPHPLMQKAKIRAVPFFHPDLEKWRTNFTGVQTLHAPTNFLVTGAVDDLWENDQGELIVVDYKATAKAAEITDLNQEWHSGYKRQIEIYQWIYRQAGFPVSPIGYFLYVNGSKEGGFYRESEGRMQFVTTLLRHEGNTDWVEGAITDAVACFESARLPESAADCDTCRYVAEREGVTLQ